MTYILCKKEGSEKERFLHHPSLRSKRKGRQKDTNTETHSKRYRSSLSIFPSASSIPYLNSVVHRPLAASTTIPVVIVTPSTPTRALFPVKECLLPSLSLPLELADATTEPSQHLPINVKQSVAEDTGEVSLSLEKQVLVPPDVENDISDIEFDSWTISAGQASLGGSEAAEPSFFLPEYLQKITFEPMRCASHALSAVSDMLSDVPVWSGVEALGVGVPSYFTSTPPKRRRSAGSRDIENNYVEAIDPHDSPSHDTFYHYVDLIPYPDVFDLDMYSIPLRKKPKSSYDRDCTFGNTLSLENDGLTDAPPPCERLPSDNHKEGSRMAIFSVVSSSSPVTYHERGDNTHQSPSTPRSISENTSSPQSQQHNRIPLHNSSNPHCITPLNDSTNTSLENSPTSVMTSPSSTLYSIEKSTTTRVESQREPICSVRALTDSRSSPLSHCPQRCRTSSDSEPESDAGSMDALKARLREVCDDFSTPPFTEEIEIWEPVTL